MVKEFALNDERLKNNGENHILKNYLLEFVTLDHHRKYSGEKY